MSVNQWRFGAKTISLNIVINLNKVFTGTVRRDVEIAEPNGKFIEVIRQQRNPY